MTPTALTEENYLDSYTQFRDRQAGVNPVYCPVEDRYVYNVYCLELLLMKDIYSVEYDFLDDALKAFNAEFGQWELKSHDKKNDGCGSCAAK